MFTQRPFFSYTFYLFSGRLKKRSKKGISPECIARMLSECNECHCRQNRRRKWKMQVQNDTLEGMREICPPFSREMRKTFFKENFMYLHSLKVMQTGIFFFFFALFSFSLKENIITYPCQYLSPFIFYFKKKSFSCYISLLWFYSFVFQIPERKSKHF